jgi:acetyl esterase/lipase
MSREQRMRVDAMVRRPIPTGPRPIEEMRAGFAALMAMMCVPEQVRSSPVTLGGRPGVLVESEQAGRPGTILYFHGGSFTLGSPETAMSLTANLVVRTGMRAFSLDYRLAPEHPFPAGLEDALAAYRDLLDAGNDPESICVRG